MRVYFLVRGETNKNVLKWKGLLCRKEGQDGGDHSKKQT